MPRASWWETFREMLHYRDRTLELVGELYRRHGPVVFQQTALAPLVSLFGPDANRFVLLNQQQALSSKRAWDLIMGRIFTNGLLLRDGEDHRHHRRIMQVAFHQNALREYVDPRTCFMVHADGSLRNKRYHLDGTALPWFRAGFASLHEDELAKAVRILAESWPPDGGT